MMPKVVPSCLRFASFLSLPVSLMLINLPAPNAIARSATDWNQFDVCVNQLKENGVAGDKAGTACSGALIPKELSECVVIIRARSPIDADSALQACYQVRRPIDLGNCVADIQKASLGGYTTPASRETTGAALPADSPSMVALESCRKSLLPGRHSECVIALSRDTANYTPIKAMDTCLAAEDFPRDLFPAYSQQQVQ